MNGKRRRNEPDYARGLDADNKRHARPDYARGLDSPHEGDKYDADFARGQEGHKRRSDKHPDYARGLHEDEG